MSSQKISSNCSLYNVSSVSTTSRKVKIAIIIAYTYPNIKADLKTYWQSYINYGPNSTPPNITVYTMPNAVQNSTWAQEECLDVQMICNINPNADIYVVEAKSNNIIDLMSAVKYATNTINADVLSMSWGTDDSTTLTQYNSNFNNPLKCYCVSSGDSNTVRRNIR